MAITPKEYLQACKDDCRCKGSSFDLSFAKEIRRKGQAQLSRKKLDHFSVSKESFPEEHWVQKL